MKSMQSALILKDIRGITASKQSLIAMIVVPLVLTVFIPSVFIILLHFIPNELSEFETMLSMLSIDVTQDNMNIAIISLLINNIMPMFFIIIPIMVSSIVAASSFVGEKEKRTLETLLYCPLSLKQIFQAKIMSSFIMSTLVSIISFVIMIIVTQIEIFFTTGMLLLPSYVWLVVLIILSPAVSLIAITLIVRGSAKAQTMEESQQRSGLLVLPVVFFVAGQFMGLFLVNAWILLGISLALSVVAYFLMSKVYKNISYETILK